MADGVVQIIQRAPSFLDGWIPVCYHRGNDKAGLEI